MKNNKIIIKKNIQFNRGENKSISGPIVINSFGEKRLNSNIPLLQVQLLRKNAVPATFFITTKTNGSKEKVRIKSHPRLFNMRQSLTSG